VDSFLRTAILVAIEECWGGVYPRPLGQKESTMQKNRSVFWILLIVAFLLAWGGKSTADTKVHGFNIPTAESSTDPHIAVCGATSSGTIEGGVQGRLADRRMSGTDSRTYGVAYCFPTQRVSGPREVSVPDPVTEAIEVVEHKLVTFFDHDSADFSDLKAEEAIKVIVDWLRTTPSAGLVVKGHTDSTGDPDYNMALSVQRAETVKMLFVEAGVSPDRIKSVGYGETSLLVNVLGRNQENRRVEIEVFQIEEVLVQE